MFAQAAALLPFLLLATAAPHVKRADNQEIHLNGDTSKCLGVAKLEDGSPIINVPCNSDNKFGWTINNGNNPEGIRLTGTNFCLDAGSTPSNNGPLKIWTCYPGAPQQTWWYTDDKHLAITGGNQCVDIGQDYIQTYECIGYNTNQIFTVGGASPPPSTTVPPPTTPPPTPVPSGKQIHFQGSSTGCLQVGGGWGGVGTPVAINHCADPNAANQLRWQEFDIQRGSGLVRLSSEKDLCLSTTAGGAWNNGSPITLQKCDANLQEQKWFYTDDNHLAIEGGNQCLNVKAESTSQPTRPQGTLQDLQTWSCSGSDAQQIFTV